MNKKRIWFIALFSVIMACFLVACQQNLMDETTIKLNKSELSLEVDGSEMLTATVSVEGLTVTWTSTNKAVATIANSGLVTAIAEGTTTVTASIGDIQDSCVVTVTKKTIAVSKKPVFIEEEGYDGELYISNYISASDVNLKEGLKAYDYLGVELEYTVISTGNFDVTKLGKYEVSYSVSDTANNTQETFKRDVYVTYYGIEEDFLNNKEISSFDEWTYAVDNDADKTATEWGQQVVAGHSVNWNKFEGPEGMPCLIMHGSDTNGHDSNSGEVDDEIPNTLLWNKITINSDKPVFRIYCSNNPYPDYNNLISKFRVSVMHINTWTSEIALDYVQIQAPLNDDGTGLNYDRMRTGTYIDADLSAFSGETVIVFIEQDASTNVYQQKYFEDIGYLDFQAADMIQETRDTLVIYTMKMVKKSGFIVGITPEQITELAVDNSTVWGTDSADGGAWGLRGDASAKSKWHWYSNGNIGTQLLHALDIGAGFQSIAYEGNNDSDTEWVADAVFANKIKVTNNYLSLFAGCDDDTGTVNLRVRIVLEDGSVVALSTAKTNMGYTAAENGWGTIGVGQWVYGTEVVYDLSAYLNQTVTILIEQDQNETAEGTSCTMWLNKIELIAYI